MARQNEIKYEALMVRSQAGAGIAICGTSYYFEWTKWPRNNAKHIQADRVLLEGLAAALRCKDLDLEFPPAIISVMNEDGAIKTKPVWDYRFASV